MKLKRNDDGIEEQRYFRLRARSRGLHCGIVEGRISLHLSGSAREPAHDFDARHTPHRCDELRRLISAPKKRCQSAFKFDPYRRLSVPPSVHDKIETLAFRRQTERLAAVSKDRDAKSVVVDRLVRELAATKEDNTAKSEVIERLLKELAVVGEDRTAKAR
jgi:hypothetical protein